VPDHDVHTEHDPREPVVGHARVEDGALSEPATGETPVEGSATTYESAAHNGHDAEDDRTGHDGEDDRARHDTEDDRAGHDAEDDRAADEARAGEDGFTEPPADDEAFRDRTTHDEAFEEEARGDRPTDDHATADAGDLTYTGEIADLPDHPDTGTGTDRADVYHGDVDQTDVDQTDVDRAETDADHPTAVDDTAVDDTAVDDTAVDDTAVVDDAAGAAASGTPAPPVHPEAGTGGDQALKPGAAPTTPARKLWADADVDGLRARWRDLQLKFIDDPQAVAGEAESLVAEAVDALTAALNARKDELSDWREAGTGGDDTERLRAAVRRYRDLFDQLLGL
jgi:hypothetical protein